MKKSTAISPARRLLLASALIFGAANAGAACGLGSPVSWTVGTSGNWTTGTNWSSSPAYPNGSSANVCIVDGASTVTLGANVSVGSLQLASGNTLTQSAGTQLALYGSQLVNDGRLVINGGAGANTYLFVNADTTLSGSGTLTLKTTASGGGSALLQNSAGGTKTLANQSTIQGSGIIGNGTGLAINNSGTIAANSVGGALTTILALNGTGGITNSGVLKAANRGVLQLINQGINNKAGSIVADGVNATVQLHGSTIRGGTLSALGGGVIQNYGSSTLDGSSTAGAISISGTYAVTGSSIVYVAGALINSGDLLLNGGGGVNSHVLLSGDTTLSGGGTVSLVTAGGGGAAYLYGGSGVSLTNVDNTIHGAGYLGAGQEMVLVNQAAGVIDANVSGGVLQLRPLGSTSTNRGVMQASNGGVLELYGFTLDNAGSTITAKSASTVVLDGGFTLQGGTLSNEGGSLMTAAGHSATLDGSTLGALTLKGTYTVSNSSTTYFFGDLVNKGAFLLNGGAGAYADFRFTGEATLSGGGTISLKTDAGGGSARFFSTVSGATLTNVDNRIQGAGNIGLGQNTVLINQAAGVIDANTAGGVLQLQVTGKGSSNRGVMQASNGGVLDLTGFTLDNAGSAITAKSGSTVVLDSGMTILGGTLRNEGGSLMGASGHSVMLDGSTLGALTLKGIYTVSNNSTTFFVGDLVNDGAFRVDGGNGRNAELRFTGDATLSGGGKITLTTVTGGGAALLYGTAGGATLNNADNRIQGAGNIGLGQNTVLLNQAAGVIDANAAGGMLQLQMTGKGSSNRGLIQASNGGLLELTSLVLDNEGGLIRVGERSTVQFDSNPTIQGGTLSNEGGSLLNVSGHAATLDGSAHGALTLKGIYTVSNNSTTFFVGDLVNEGIFQVNGGNGRNAELRFTGDATLSGGGKITLTTVNTGGGAALLYGSAGGSTLTNVDNTIEGAGNIGLGQNTVLLNQAAGVIDANAAGGVLQIQMAGAGSINSGVLQASNGGTLELSGFALNNDKGQIRAGSGSTVQLDNSMVIEGGRLGNEGGSLLVAKGHNATLDGATRGALNLAGTFTVSGSSRTYLAGTIVNAGQLSIEGGAGSDTLLALGGLANGEVVLNGGGAVTLNTASGGGRALIYNTSFGVTLSNADNVIQGSGAIGLGQSMVLNNLAAGVIDANVSGGVLQLQPAGTGSANVGLIQASSGGVLELTGFTLNNEGGRIRAGSASTVQLDSNMIVQGGLLANDGGTLLTAAGHSVKLDGETHGALTISGSYTGASASITTLVGAIANQGEIRILGGSGSDSRLLLGGSSNGVVSLSGGGKITLSEASGGGRAYLYNSAFNVALDNVDNTIQGSGLLGYNQSMTLKNGGTIAANATGKALVVQPSKAFVNTGTLLASDGGTLDVKKAFSGNGIVRVDGASQFLLGETSSTGTLINNGTIANALNLGTSGITVSSDYRNASFGVGNAFDRRANVTGSGLILAAGDAVQVLGGATVSGGASANAVLKIGNVHVGDNTVSYRVGNGGSTGPALRGAIQTSGGGANISDARLSGTGVTAGNYGPLAAGTYGDSLIVNFHAGSVGALAPLSGQALRIVSNFDNVSSQLLSLQLDSGAAAYRLASASTLGPVSFGNVRIGTVADRALSISNTAANDGFSEKLDASISSNGSPVSASGAFTLLGPQAGDSTSLHVGLDTSSAGAKSGSATIALASNGQGTSGLGITALASQTVVVSGKVYRLAQGSVANSVTVANQHVGDGGSQILTVSNVAANDGYSEKLVASFAATSGAATHNGGSVNLLSAGGSSNALAVGVDTASAGHKSGTVSLNYVSDGSGTSALVATGAGGQSVSVSGDVFRLASANTLSPVSFGNVHVGDAVQQALTITNTAANDGYSEKLAASFGARSDGRILVGGSVSGLAAGASSTAMSVGLDTSAAGVVNGNVVVRFASDGAGTSGLGVTDLAAQTVGVSGQITGSVYRLASASAAAPNPVDFGNVRIGTVADRALSISNTAANDGFSEKLDASISSNGSPVSASGAFTLLGPQAGDSTSLHVGLDTSSAGAKSGSATIALASNGQGTSGLGITALASQTVVVSGKVYRLAQGSVANSVTVAARVGDAVSASQGVLVANTSPDAWTEALRVTVGPVSGNAQSNSGSIAALAAQGADSHSIRVGLASTAKAGITTGQVALDLASTGAGTTGAADASLGSAIVEVVGKVYQQAQASLDRLALNFGIVHKGDSVAAQQVLVSNSAASTALNDVLQGAVGAVGKGFSVQADSGLGVGLGAGETGHFSVGLDTAHSGLLGANAELKFASADPDLAVLALADQTLRLSAQVNEYAKADLLKTQGSGSLTRKGNTITLDLGRLGLGSGSVEIGLEAINAASGLADELSGAFDLSGADDFALSGFDPFSGLAAGDFKAGMAISFDASRLGSFSDRIVLNANGYNGSGYRDDQGLILILNAEVLSAGPLPEPQELSLILLALAALALGLRRPSR